MINNRVFTTVVCALVLTPVVQAAEWSLTGDMNSSIEYNDNVFMDEDLKVSSYHAIFTPTLTIKRKQEDSSVSLDAGYTVHRYSSLKNLDNQNPFITFQSQFYSDRSNWGLVMSHRQASSRIDADEDTGDFTTESIVTTQSIAPSFNYLISERNTLVLKGQYTTKDYSTNDFNSNDSWSLSTGLSHLFSERFTAGLLVRGSRYESSGNSSSNKFDSYELSSTISYSLSEKWKFDAAVGATTLKSDQVSSSNEEQSNSTSGNLFNFNLSRKTELGSLTMGLSRSLFGTSLGQVDEQDRLNLSWSHKLTENLTTKMAMSYQQASTQFEEINEERENISFSPSLNWKYSPNLSFEFQYKYRQQKQLEITADSNIIMARVIYDWNGLRVSR